MHAVGACGLDVIALRLGPVFIVANGHENIVIGWRRSVRVLAGAVGDVVPARFEPAEHRVFVAEKEGDGPAV